MRSPHDLEPLIAADPARQLDPTPQIRARTRARLDALLAAEPVRRRTRRRTRAVAAAGLATFAAVAAIVAGSLSGSATSPAQAFAARLQGDGILHMLLAAERIHDASGNRTSPRRDELWLSLADGTWRVRSRLNGYLYDTAFDGRSITTYSSRTGKTIEETPTNPSLLVGHPLTGPLSPAIEPLRDVEAGRLKVAGEATIDGETVYDLTPTQDAPQELQLHWYVSKDGRLRRMVQSAADTIDESRGTRGPTSVSIDVSSYDVLVRNQANQNLLRPQAPK
jgi:hypothetical protein